MQFTRIITTLALVSSSLLTASGLNAQCCKDKMKAGAKDCDMATAKATPSAKAGSIAITLGSKVSINAGKVKLFNEVCPITGLPTTASTPMAVFGKTLISLCCNGCQKAFAALPSKNKAAFVAKYSGKNARSKFPAVAKATKTGATKPCPDCADGKSGAKASMDCKDCPSGKAGGKDCPSGKAGGKDCPHGKPAGKAAGKECCDEKAAAKSAAKKECCDEKAAAKSAAKKECCDEKAAAKPAAKKECCDEKAAAKKKI